MASIVLPLMLACWILISVWAAHRIGEWSAERGGPGGLVASLRLELKALVLLVLIPLPLIDELLAKPQFDALCREQVAVKVQPGITPDRRVHRSVLPSEPLPGLMVPVTQRKHLYIDDETHQTLVSFNTFEARPGKLARLMGLTAAPLTFEGRCEPVNPVALLASAGLKEPGPTGAGVPGH